MRRAGPYFGFGLRVAALTFLADQATKLWVLFVYELDTHGTVAVLPFLDLVMVWNRGISYGLFQQDDEIGRWTLIVISIVASVALTLWLRSEASRLAALGMGLILGGALGNVVDRVAYGAVADFIFFHIGSFRWYVFNIADAAIVVGVGLLLYGALRRGDRTEAHERTAADREEARHAEGGAPDGTKP